MASKDRDTKEQIFARAKQEGRIVLKKIETELDPAHPVAFGDALHVTGG